MLVTACAGEALPTSSGVPADAGVASQAPCPPLEPLCATGGYAHFRVSNVEGSGLPNEASYLLQGDLATDRVTQLVWQRTSSPESMGWDEARGYCDQLELGGRDDFRLPGRIELITVLDFERVPVVATAFEGAADYHFSSSRASFVEGSAFSVYFGAGETTIARANPGRARALCVAGDIAAVPEPRFTRDGDWVLDAGTALLWEVRLREVATFEQASERCAEAGVRLPSIRELQTIVDETRYDPAIDATFFPDTPSESFWSSSLREGWPWLVDFSDGTTRADIDPNEMCQSRCVR